ncbi:MAG: PHB depolymerase family esterase [Pyrinomonadaceae bacterium]
MKMSIPFAKTLFTVAVVVSAFSNLFSQKVETGFLNRVVSVNGSEYRYQVYVPREFTRGKTWPVILFLHGGGQYGRDGIKQTNVGLARAVREYPERFPAIVVFPQARADNLTPGWQLEGGRAALAALDNSIKEFQGDKSRVYLTGLSAGGNGSWFLASRYPERFAAAVVVCGFISKFKGGTSAVDYPALAPPEAFDPYAFIAQRVAKIPLWIFHGDADQSVSVEESRKMYAALKATSANVQYTELPGLGHNVWDPAFARPDLIDWLLKQRKK